MNASRVLASCVEGVVDCQDMGRTDYTLIAALVGAIAVVLILAIILRFGPRRRK